MHQTAELSVDDPDVVTGLAATHGASMRGFARNLGLTDQQAEDCVQEAMVRLWTQLERDVHVVDPKGWAYRTVYRLAMDEHRRRRRRAEIPLEPHGPVGGPGETTDATDRIAAWGEIRHLSIRQREVLHLRYVADLPFGQIGDILGITAVASRSHASQAVRTLRHRLDPASDLDVGPTLRLAATHVETHEYRASSVVTLGTLEEPPGGLLMPGGIDVDLGGHIWVVDAGHDRIAIFAPDGRFLERWGQPGSDRGKLSFRRALGTVGDIRFASDGSFYVADNGNFRIQRFDGDRRFVGSWGGFGRGDGEFLDPWSVRLDAIGQVYVSDAIREDIQVFTSDGRYLRTIGRGGSEPGQLAFQGDAMVLGDRMFVADHWNARIAVFGTDGTPHGSLTRSCSLGRMVWISVRMATCMSLTLPGSGSWS